MKNLKQFFRPNFFSLLAIAFSIFAFGPFSSPQKSVSVAADKMNVFYVGVDNPITVAVEGIPDEEVKVHSDQVKLEKVGIGKYIVKASRLGNVKILVYGDGFETEEFEFRVKRIPDPTAALYMQNETNWMQGEISAEDFKQAAKLGTSMGDFMFSFNAEITTFTITRVPANGEAIELRDVAGGSDFGGYVRDLIDAAMPGDTYYFNDVKGKFPGMDKPWKLNSLVFRIK
ncbi:MAG: hypothetical protein GC192_16080 [Bacteroidetes bacterium]|nr:hypothetical protein [Bacteroidota bacterium]